MPSISISGIPNSTGLSPSITKNLYFTTLSLCHNLTVFFYVWVIVHFLITALFLVAHSCSNVNFVNRFLNLLNDIRLSLVHASILYIIWVHLWLMLDSTLVNITDFTLSRLRYFALTTSKLLSHLSGLPTQVIFLAHIMYHLPTPALMLLPHQLAYCLEVVLLSTSTAFLTVCRAMLGGCSVP